MADPDTPQPSSKPFEFGALAFVLVLGAFLCWAWSHPGRPRGGPPPQPSESFLQKQREADSRRDELEREMQQMKYKK